MPRLREAHEIGVPIELPEISDFANEAGITMIETFAEPQRRFDAGLWISVPKRRKA
jgi:hypothetical protein